MSLYRLLFIMLLSIPTLVQGQSSTTEDAQDPDSLTIEGLMSDPSIEGLDSPFINADVMPEFPGGFNALSKYLSANIEYPEAMKKAGLQGTVFVTFVVETDGLISEVQVLRGIGGGCDAEAIRVVEGMPAWTPGSMDGRSVRVQYNLPIRFLLDEEPVEEH